MACISTIFCVLTSNHILCSRKRASSAFVLSLYDLVCPNYFTSAVWNRLYYECYEKVYYSDIIYSLFSYLWHRFAFTFSMSFEIWHLIWCFQYYYTDLLLFCRYKSNSFCWMLLKNENTDVTPWFLFEKSYFVSMTVLDFSSLAWFSLQLYCASFSLCCSLRVILDLLLAVCEGNSNIFLIYWWTTKLYWI